MSEAEIQAKVVDLLQRDTEEAIPFYSKALSERLGYRRVEDMPPRERFAFYLARPPILRDGLPPEDQDGVFPRWYQIAATDQAYYQERVQDYINLMARAVGEGW